MQIDFPLDIDIFEDDSALAVGLLSRLTGRPDRFVLLSGATVSSEYARELVSDLGDLISHHFTVESTDVSAVYSMERQLRILRPNLIIAVGGGRVADFSKRLAYIANIPLLLIPTIIANDGLISPVAVLEDDGGSVSLPGRMPDTVLIDLSTIRKAPKSYLQAAACDLITNLSATNDWERSTYGDGGRLHHLALQMSRMAAHQILDSRDWTYDSPVFLRTIVYGQMLSGIAMALAGSSRPCSGSEHLISHALDSLDLGRDVLHGKKVGITSRFCLHLQDFHDPQLEIFFRKFEVDRLFPGCENFSKDQMITVFERAREMRPGRVTILDNFSNSKLAESYLDYVETSENMQT